jgi:hypothetical protein
VKSDSNRSKRSVETAPANAGQPQPEVDEFGFAVEALPSLSRTSSQVSAPSKLQEFIGTTSPQKGDRGEDSFGIKTGETAPSKLAQRMKNNRKSDPGAVASLGKFLFNELEAEVIEKIEPEHDQVEDAKKPRTRISQEARKSMEGQGRLVMKGGDVIPVLSPGRMTRRSFSDVGEQKERLRRRASEAPDNRRGSVRRSLSADKAEELEGGKDGSMSSRRRAYLNEKPAVSGRERRSMRGLNPDEKPKSIRRRSAPAKPNSSDESIDTTWDLEVEAF